MFQIKFVCIRTASKEAELKSESALPTAFSNDDREIKLKRFTRHDTCVSSCPVGC